MAVATATPAMAASRGPLTFTGEACKLPGNSSSIFKGYVLELLANNILGPNPLNTVTVITGVSVSGLPEDQYAVKVIGGNPATCTCQGSCGVGGLPQFCTPDGTLNQRILVYTSDDLTGSSSNTAFTVSYQRYECTGTTCVAFDPSPVTITTSVGTPPATPGGGSCDIVGVFPLPDGGVPFTTTTTTVAPGTTTTTTTEAPVTTTTTTAAP